MYIDSSQLNELVDAVIICYIRITNKTLQQSNSICRLSIYLIFLGSVGLILTTFFLRSHWIAWIFILLLIIIANYGMRLSINIIRSIHIPSLDGVIEQAKNFADDLPNLEADERLTYSILIERIYDSRHSYCELTLIRNLLLEIEDGETGDALRDWPFIAIVKKAFE